MKVQKSCVLCDPVLRERIGAPVPELPGLPAGSPWVEVVLRREEVAALERMQLRGANREAVRVMRRLRQEAQALEEARLAEPLRVWVQKCWEQRKGERAERKLARSRSQEGARCTA
jgi:hypothetical protein